MQFWPTVFFPEIDDVLICWVFACWHVHFTVFCVLLAFCCFLGGLKCAQNKILSPFVLVTVWPRKHQNDPWGQLQSEGLMWVSDVVADCFGNKCLGGELSDRWRDEHNVFLCEVSQCEISCSFIRAPLWCLMPAAVMYIRSSKVVVNTLQMRPRPHRLPSDMSIIS